MTHNCPSPCYAAISQKHYAHWQCSQNQWRCFSCKLKITIWFKSTFRYENNDIKSIIIAVWRKQSPTEACDYNFCGGAIFFVTIQFVIDWIKIEKCVCWKQFPIGTSRNMIKPQASGRYNLNIMIVCSALKFK